MEEEINKDLMDGLAAQADNLTVYDLCEKYILTKINVTKNTQAQYKTVLNVLRKHPFGKRKISSSTNLPLVKLPKICLPLDAPMSIAKKYLLLILSPD